MPGILGIISHELPEACESLVRGMAMAMVHDPFCVLGVCSVPEMGVYAGWVSHESSFAARQVFFNERRDIALVFSGECFLDSQIGPELRERGHQISQNKGSWLVHLYEAQGSQFFEKLNGLFSGLLIDKRKQKAFLFNDRYGVERIYWYENHAGFYFASEAKALLRVLPELRAFDEEGVAQYLAFGCTLKQKTLFRNISLLPGASAWCFEARKCHKLTYFSPETWEAQPVLSPEAFEDQFQETFSRILPAFFESDVRIGISLTGGLDTRMIMACLPETAEKPVCYTFAGSTGETLDVRLAARIARTCGLRHETLRIGPDFFQDFASLADRTVYITDGYFGASGAHELYMSRLARRLSPIRLTGNYGSEVLRGVSTFKPLALSPALVSPRFSVLVESCVRELNTERKHPVTFAAFQEVPWNLFGSLAVSRSQLGFRSPFLDNETVRLAYQSPQSIRKSQLPGLRFVESNNCSLGRISTDKGYAAGTSTLTALARRCFSRVTFKLDYINNEGLPHCLSRLDPWLSRLAACGIFLGLHKHLHYRSWFRRELADYVKTVLTDRRTRSASLWNPRFLAHMADEHTRGRANYAGEINAVLTMEAVERLLFRELPISSTDEAPGCPPARQALGQNLSF